MQLETGQRPIKTNAHLARYINLTGKINCWSWSRHHFNSFYKIWSFFFCTFLKFISSIRASLWACFFFTCECQTLVVGCDCNLNFSKHYRQRGENEEINVYTLLSQEKAINSD